MEYKTIEELTTVVTGGTPSTSKPEYWKNGNIPWLQSGCCQNCEVNRSEKYISKLGYDNSSAQMMPKNSVMVALTGATAGKIGYLNFEACGNQSITGIFPCNEINQRFLFYYLISQRNKILADCVGGAQPHISQGYVKKIKVPIYNIEKQNRIVKRFDLISNIIKNDEKEIEKYDDLIKARFVEMFGDPVENPMGWKKRMLQEIVTDDCTISYGIVQTGNGQEEGVPVLRPVDIVNKVPKLIELKKTTKEISNKYKKTILKGRELLITVRANIADTCIVDEEFKGCNVGRGIVPIRIQEDIMLLEFLKYLLDSKHLNDDIKSKAKGITLIQLNMEDLREVELISPPIEKQSYFVEFAKQVDKSKLAVQQSLEKTQQLFDSLMQEYFG